MFNSLDACTLIIRAQCWQDCPVSKHTVVVLDMHDHSWNQENPGWLRATVYAAQFTAWGWSLAEHPQEGLRRCAACAVQIPECHGKACCSKCKLVRLRYHRLIGCASAIGRNIGSGTAAGLLLQPSMPAQSSPFTQTLLPSACPTTIHCNFEGMAWHHCQH